MTENTQIATFTPEQRSILLDTICKGVNTEDFLFMLELAKKYKLDPFARQIFCTKMGIIISRDGYLAIAHRNPNFDGIHTEFEHDEHGNPIVATTTVWRKDWSHPVTEPAYWSDYNKGTDVWNRYKHAMLQKVSERMALSRAFCITGVYSDAELDTQVPPVHSVGDLGECIDVDPIVVKHDNEPTPAEPSDKEPSKVEPAAEPEKTETKNVCPICGKPSMSEYEFMKIKTVMKNNNTKVDITPDMCYECAGKKYKEAVTT